MDKIFEKMSLYDVVGYIIPGFLGTWILNVFFIDILKVQFFVKLDNGFINSVMFVAVSFYIGVILHEFSEVIEKHFFRNIWGGLPSERFLVDSDKKYSKDYKENLKNKITHTFGITLDNSKNKNQEAFNLVYSCVLLKNKESKSQLFNVIYYKC